MAGHGEKKTIEFGPHFAVFEPPDLLAFTFRGVVRADHVATYAAERGPLLDGTPHVLNLVDLREAAGFDAEGRKAVANIRDPRPSATAMFGGGFAFRVTVEMIVNAARLLSRRTMTVRFFADERLARAWLAEMREQFKAT